MSDRSVAGRDERLSLRDHGYVTFRLEKQWLGVPVVLIQEVLAGQAVTPVPLSPNQVQGFLNLRGQIVTAVDLRAVLGLPPRSESASHMNVVVQREEEFFSLIVDEVGDVLEVGERGVEPTPKTLDALWKSCSLGVIRMDQGLLVVLDVDTVLALEGAKAA